MNLSSRPSDIIHPERLYFRSLVRSFVRSSARGPNWARPKKLLVPEEEWFPLCERPISHDNP